MNLILCLQSGQSYIFVTFCGGPDHHNYLIRYGLSSIYAVGSSAAVNIPPTTGTQ